MSNINSFMNLKYFASYHMPGAVLGGIGLRTNTQFTLKYVKYPETVNTIKPSDSKRVIKKSLLCT